MSTCARSAAKSESLALPERMASLGTHISNRLFICPLTPWGYVRLGRTQLLVPKRSPFGALNYTSITDSECQPPVLERLEKCNGRC